MKNVFNLFQLRVTSLTVAKSDYFSYPLAHKLDKIGSFRGCKLASKGLITWFQTRIKVTLIVLRRERLLEGKSHHGGNLFLSTFTLLGKLRNESCLSSERERERER